MTRKIYAKPLGREKVPGKRRLNGEHVLVERPEERMRLSDDFVVHLKQAVKDGCDVVETDLSRQLTIVTDEDFAEFRQRFTDRAKGNLALLYLQLSVFFASIYLQLTNRNLPGNSSETNKFLVATMSQRDLTLAIMYLDAMEFNRVSTVGERIDLSFQWWTSHFSGALAVARASTLLLHEGATVRLPTPREDLLGKIDLIASFPGRSEGLCIQVKSFGDNWFKYRSVKGIDEHRASKYDRSLLKGAQIFQSTYKGLWIPIEISLGSAGYQDKSIEPVGPIIDLFARMLEEVLEEHVLSARTL